MRMCVYACVCVRECDILAKVRSRLLRTVNQRENQREDILLNSCVCVRAHTQMCV